MASLEPVEEGRQRSWAVHRWTAGRWRQCRRRGSWQPRIAYCARPVELDCHFESICESCTFFVTTNQFRPTLQAQREDAAAKGQIGRIKVFDRLLARLDSEPSPAPEHEAS